MQLRNGVVRARTVARQRSESAVASTLSTHAVKVAYDHPTPSVPAQEWACAGGDPELFFPADDATLARAAGVCGGCALRQACLDLAVARNESGVWGGVLLADGKALDKVPVRGRPRKVAAA